MEAETYILLVLADSNLPTGSFVASSGLESFEKHGFLRAHPDLVSFLQHSLDSYAHSALPFLADAYEVASNYTSVDDAMKALCELDDLYEASTLNHVAQRASTTYV